MGQDPLPEFLISVSHVLGILNKAISRHIEETDQAIHNSRVPLVIEQIRFRLIRKQSRAAERSMPYQDISNPSWL